MHAAAAPRYLRLRCVIAKSFARIHRQNLINYGVLPLLFRNDDDYERLERGDRLWLDTRTRALETRDEIPVKVARDDARLF